MEKSHNGWLYRHYNLGNMLKWNYEAIERLAISALEHFFIRSSITFKIFIVRPVCSSLKYIFPTNHLSYIYLTYDAKSWEKDLKRWIPRKPSPYPGGDNPNIPTCHMGEILNINSEITLKTRKRLVVVVFVWCYVSDK